MLTLFICVLQITLVAAVAGVVGKVFLPRVPQLSAWTSLLGLAACGFVVLAAVVDAPRLWTFNANEPMLQTQSLATEANNFVDNTLHALPQDSSANGPAGMDLSALLRRIQSLTQPNNPRASSRLSWLVSCIVALVSVWSVRVVIGTHALGRLHKNSTRTTDSDCLEQFRRLQAGSLCQANIELRDSDRIASPCVGWLHPRTIYLPSSFASWSRGERDVALAHEIAHLERHDARLRLLAELLSLGTWWHPLCYILRRQLITSQELATDRRAADRVGGVQAYKKSLSLLALRMDSQRRKSFVSYGVSLYGVSVSTNEVVRRIQMLNSVKPYVARWQTALAATALLTSSLLAMSWTANADEPQVRLASAKKSPSAKELYFQDAKSKPWEELGESFGYVEIFPERLSQNASAKVVYTMLTSDIFKNTTSESGGNAPVAPPLALADFERILVNTGAQVEFIPEDQQQDEHRHMLTLMADRFILSTRQETDWASVASAMNWSVFASIEQCEPVIEHFREIGVSSRIELLSKEPHNCPSDLQADMQSMWSRVCGGAMTVVSNIPQEFKDTIDKGKPVDPTLEFLSSVKAVAIGVDISGETGRFQVQCAFMPRERFSASEVQQRLAAVRQKSLPELKDQLAGQDNFATVLNELENLEIAVEVHDAREMVMVTGSLSDILAILL